MIDELRIAAELDHTLDKTDFPTLGALYRGKVRDVYKTPERLVIITTDRVSAFDRVLGTIPFKGAILNGMAADGFLRTKDLVPNHVISVPDPNVLVAKPVRAYPVEFVVRGYITGSLWRDYNSGKAHAYGIDFGRGLKKDQRFSSPMLTPTTKAEIGAHDQPISKQEIVAKGLMTAAELDEAEAAAYRLFARGSERATARGLILVDTKYELGKDESGRLTLIDEIHTPDSSRYWIAKEYEERFRKGEAQAMLDKENLRGWLMEEHGFSGHGDPPPLSRDIRITLARRYLEAFEQIVGEPFRAEGGDVRARIERNLRKEGLV